MDWKNDLAKREAEQSGELPVFGSLGWAKSVVANPPKLAASDHLALARAQVKVALQMLTGDDPQLGVAEMCLEEAAAHARKAMGGEGDWFQRNHDSDEAWALRNSGQRDE